MKTRDRTAVHAAIFAFALTLLPALATAAITDRIRSDCKPDYQRYCKAYAVGSEALRACMSRSARRLSRSCVAALVDGGEMTKAEAAKLHKAPAKKRSTHKRSSKKH